MTWDCREAAKNPSKDLAGVATAISTGTDGEADADALEQPTRSALSRAGGAMAAAGATAVEFLVRAIGIGAGLQDSSLDCHGSCKS